ncbi:unnamed protein product [Aphanomyces euteiches]
MSMRSTLKLPLADDFFQLPALTADEVERYRAIGSKAAADLIRYTELTGGPIDWTFHSNNSTATMYSGRDEDVPIFRVYAEIEATIEDIVSIFLTPTTAETRQIMAVYLPLFVDKVRLCNLTLPTAESPYFYQSLNWSIAESPLKGVILKHRDWSYVEHQEEVMIHGRRAWLRAVTHVDIPGCPDLEARYGVVRGHMLHTGYVYIESDRPGVLEHIALYHNKANGHLTGPLGDYLLNKVTEGHYRAIKDAEHVVRAYQLSRLDMVPPHKLPAIPSTTKCGVCLKKLGHFNEKDHCRRCAKIVCTKRGCSKVWKFLKVGIQVHARICRVCSNAAKSTSLLETSTLRSETDSSSTWDDDASTDAFSSWTPSRS